MHKDEDGNVLRLWNDGVYLKLKSEKNPRKIFELGRNKIIKRVKQRNVMRINGGMVGFNYHALKLLSMHPRMKNAKIHVLYRKKRYIIDPLDVINEKEFLHFKTEGFELQCFYPISKMEEA